MNSLKTIIGAAIALATAFAVGCSTEPNSPTAPSRAAQTAASPGSVMATGAVGTQAMSHPSAGATGPSVIGFPPRNEPNAFFQDLTALYRDFLRRPQTSPTYVDPEGQNVWLTEYFRFYLNGCSHQEAVSRTLAEITSGGTRPVCGQETPSFPPRNLPNEFQGQLENTYRDALRRVQILSYVDSEGANVWLAQYLRFRVSGCSHSDAENKVFTEIRGGGVQPACTATTFSLSGVWFGLVQLKTTSSTPPLNMTLVQSGSSLSGSWSMIGGGVDASGQLSGNVSGTAISIVLFRPLQTEFDTCSLTPTGYSSLQFTAVTNVDINQMVGSVVPVPCSAISWGLFNGTVTVRRQ